MSEILKPSKMNVLWASGGDILDPGDTKYATGWGVEIPPRQWENFVQNKQDSFNAHVNQHGVVAWDAETEYQANKSYVQGTTNGTIYRCIQTHTNEDPELDVGNVYWIISFASAGDFYTKAETDGLYLAKANNLSDLPSTTTARFWLDVYSKAEVYMKGEVDLKTTVASTAQSQAWASNTTLLTPLRLSEAFKGSNQSLTTNGYQRLPGGLILQWGTVSTGAANPALVNFPITFPTGVISMSFVVAQSGGFPGAGFGVIFDPTTTSFNVDRRTDAGVSSTFGGLWMAIGY